MSQLRTAISLGVALVALVLGLTIAAAPLAPGVQRPSLADLLWLPLLGLLGTIALCGAAGYFGIRTGLRLSRRAIPPPCAVARPEVAPQPGSRAADGVHTAAERVLKVV